MLQKRGISPDVLFFCPSHFSGKRPGRGDKVESALARFSDLSDLPCSQRFIPKLSSPAIVMISH